MGDKRMERPLLGLTGGLGCGKSAAASCFAEMGWKVVDADLVVRRAYEDVSGAVTAAIRSRFGDVVLSGDRTIDRAALAGIVLENTEELRWLENLARPLIWRELESAMESGEGVGVVLDLPLLFEWGWEERFPVVASVYAADDILSERLKRDPRRNVERMAALAALQKTPSEKAELADFVIVNNAGFDLLKAQCKRLSRLARGATPV